MLLKTNQELVQILKWFNGANDIEVYDLLTERVDLKKNWTLQALEIFRNGSFFFK